MRFLAAMVVLAFAATAAASNADLVVAARRQVGVTVIYDGSYRVLDYPGGDVPLERGVCIDVIVRAGVHVKSTRTSTIAACPVS